MPCYNYGTCAIYTYIVCILVLNAIAVSNVAIAYDDGIEMRTAMYAGLGSIAVTLVLALVLPFQLRARDGVIHNTWRRGGLV